MIDPANGINFNKNNRDVAKQYLERHSKQSIKSDMVNRSIKLKHTT